MAFASRAVSKRGIRDRIGITRWANVQPTAPTIVGPQTIDLTGQAIAHTRAQGALKVNPTLLPAGLAHARAQGAPTVNPKLAPAGLAHTRGQGALTVSPQLKPAGQAHTRAQGAPAVGTVLGPAGLVHTRGQGSITISPKLFPAGQAHSRALGNPTIPGATVRHIGDGLVVTVAWIPRPTGLARTRAQGAITVTGRAITPTGQARVRRQGNPTLSARTQPASIVHTRGTSSPSINTLTIAPTGLAHTGTPTQLTLTAIATDNFNRANGTIAGTNNWLATFDGSMAISSNEAIGTSSATKGDYRTETYTADQYSQCVIGSVNNTTGSFIGLTVRNSTSGNDNYLAIYFLNGTTPNFNIYKRTGGGSYTQLCEHPRTLGGQLPAGTVLTFIAEGSQLTLQVNGSGYCTVIDTTITAAGAPGILCFDPITIDSWEGGNAQTTALAAASATDNFNRTNGGMSSGQAGWAVMSGYPAVDIPIVTNQLAVSTGSHAADVRTDSYSPDHWSQIQMGATGPDSTGFVGMLTRVNPALNSGYFACMFGFAETQNDQAHSTHSYRIYRLDTGTSVFLAACAADGDGVAGNYNPAGTQYTLLSQGSRHSLRVNGKEILAVTDTTYTSGQPGIMLFPGSTADNWSGGSAATGRTIGNITVTQVEILRPTGLAHARAQGNPVAHGRTIISTPALAHARAQGNPTLSARVTPAGLAHARAQGAPEINLVTLHPLALARA